jgi:Rieske Fe-S protein
VIPACSGACPFSGDALGLASLPLGQLQKFEPRRVAAGGASPAGEVDETKRNVLKLLGIVGAGVAVGGGLVGGTLLYAQPPLVGIGSYPKVQLLDVDGSPLTAAKVMAEYDVTTPDLYLFYYPLRNEPNFLLNLAPAPGTSVGATDVPGGIGPKRSIVAYSAICQHLGCPAPALAYYPPGTCPQTPGGKPFYIHCSCHGSTYDVANGAANLTGPAVLPLPQVTLEWSPSDDLIYAVGETGPPVNGHFDTLSGDYGVGSTSQLAKQSPVILCSFPP